MRISISVSMAMFAFVLVVQPGLSEANMRLPVRCELPPSSALFSPSRDLTVLHEYLQFDCDSASCQVSATYRINSKQPVALKMSFISPSNRVEIVTVNGLETKPGSVLVAKFTDFSKSYATARENAKHLAELIKQANQNGTNSSATQKRDADLLEERYRVALKESERLYPMSKDNNHLVELFGKQTKLMDIHPEECRPLPDLSQPKGWEHYVACLAKGNHPVYGEAMFGMKQQWELYQFDFDAGIRSGENTVKVSYRQPYSMAESEVGSPPMRYVSYELWPLKEWSLDPGFKVDITVRLHNPRYGFLNMKRDGLSVSAGRFKDVRNGGLVKASSSLSPNTLESLPDGHIVYRTLLQGDIPDRLFIISGEEVR